VRAGLSTGTRRVVGPLARPLRRSLLGLRMRRWEPYSRLFTPGERVAWSVNEDALQLTRIARRLGVEVAPSAWTSGAQRQSIFYLSHFSLLLTDRWLSSNRLGVAYLHGRPGAGSPPEFAACHERLRRRHEQVERVQVPNRAMHELVIETGIDPRKTFLIPIGIDLSLFPERDEQGRLAAREALGVPREAFVVGSFQKDGVGWGEGLEPKLIKGPDLLLDAVELLRRRIPELFMLLTGPARGFVKRGLERLGVPYRHVEMSRPADVAEAYRALDVYLVSSREEGGPKAVLESMATRVPLVSTAVGQAVDLVRDGENGWLVPVGDAYGLAEHVSALTALPSETLARILDAGRRTAEANSYEALTPRWRALLDGFVDVPESGR
jgi:glycosyltransferase involved in cell wall biosynthesis